VPEGRATFSALRCARLAGMRFYKLDKKTFTFSVRRGLFRTPGLPARVEAKLPSACIVAALAGVHRMTYDFLVNDGGLALAATRRLPYAGYGLAWMSAVSASPDPQTLRTVSCGANRLGLADGGFVFLDPGGANEEYVRVISADPENQSFQAIVTKDHAAGERIRPTMWPALVLHEGDHLAFGILAVTPPDPGSDLTVLIQT
jgi:hypothetical protein